MINRQMLPAIRFDFAERIEQRVWFRIVFDARIRSDVGQGKNFERALILAGDNAARFVGCVAFSKRDELSKLLTGDMHTIQVSSWAKQRDSAAVSRITNCYSMEYTTRPPTTV